MQEILAITLQSMHQDMTRLERISTNLANALTPGFKREVVSVSPMGSSLAPAGNSFSALVASARTASEAAGTQAAQVHTDFRPGTLRATGQALDLALNGAGYFEVQTPEGLAYTRQGNFRVDGRGRLVTAQGYPVMGMGGEIFLPHASPSVDESGRVFDRSSPGVTDTNALAQIKIVRMDKPLQLERLGNGLYGSKEQAPPLLEGNQMVRQGYQENSNVSSMQEMVQLIQTMRHFESMQKVALGYDEMVGTAVRKLGELS